MEAAHGQEIVPKFSWNKNETKAKLKRPDQWQESGDSNDCTGPTEPIPLLLFLLAQPRRHLGGRLRSYKVAMLTLVSGPSEPVLLPLLVCEQLQRLDHRTILGLNPTANRPTVHLCFTPRQLASQGANDQLCRRLAPGARRSL